MAKKVYLTKDAIIAIEDRKKKEVKVPEWGGSVFITTLSAKDRDAYEASVVGTGASLENIRARFLALVIVDQDGNRLFETAKDIEALGEKSSAALNRLIPVAKEMNKLTEKDIEELSGN
jgi:hypothetical protein